MAKSNKEERILVMAPNEKATTQEGAIGADSPLDMTQWIYRLCSADAVLIMLEGVIFQNIEKIDVKNEKTRRATDALLGIGSTISMLASELSALRGEMERADEASFHK